MQYQYQTHHMIYAHINNTIITVALGELDQTKMVWGLNGVLDVSELSGQRFSSVRTHSWQGELARAGSI